MNRRNFLKTVLAVSAISANASTAADTNTNRKAKTKVLSPYSNVDWKAFGRHRAALHLHTLQSDGFQMPVEVVDGYKRAGYSIISITDHDFFAPNFHVRPGDLPADNASPYPNDPKPANYPANTTWPWTDYGCKSPESMGIVAIEGNELSYRHHINSYFNDYGVWYEKTGTSVPYGGVVGDDGKDITEDDQLHAISQKGGLAILNHPGISDEYKWWERKPLDWYAARYKKHPADYLIGMEVTNCGSPFETYDEGLWDQLLCRFMPARPIWGFGNDDMHRLNRTKQTFNLFYLADCTAANVRKAMECGQFCFCKSTRSIDYQSKDAALDKFPAIDSIAVDENAGTITISARDCDEIKWITCPRSLEPTGDYKTGDKPWPLGNVVHTGHTLNYLAAGIKMYVRAELLRKDGEHTQRLFTNPFGIETV